MDALSKKTRELLQNEQVKTAVRNAAHQENSRPMPVTVHQNGQVRTVVVRRTDVAETTPASTGTPATNSRTRS